MLTVLYGVLVFIVVILALVGVLLAAKARLVPSGDATLTVNDDPDKALQVKTGGTLLSTLTENQIFIPSGCGGKGSCGVCRAVVSAGGGPLLPTEANFISPKEARAGMRLACQVKVKEDMSIQLPPEVFDVRRWQCRVRSNRNVTT